MPNTPRERLPNDWTLDDGRVIRLITPEQLLKLPNGYSLSCIDGTKAVVGYDEIDNYTRFGYLAYGNLVTNDAGLLDQANEGSGASQEDAKYKRANDAQDSEPDGGRRATVPQPPSPAPESVEGVVHYCGWWHNRVEVPNSWPIGTKVRITRVSE